jgi:hypothetical protein
MDIFFREFNWQYDAIDRDIFSKQLSDWNGLPFNVFSTAGPQGLPPDVRVFPALLFQCLAVALLFVPDEPNGDYDALKYAGDMTFEDLAADYSESGASILSLLGKRQITLTTVQAGFLRAVFFKFTAQVTESVGCRISLVIISHIRHNN